MAGEIRVSHLAVTDEERPIGGGRSWIVHRLHMDHSKTLCLSSYLLWRASPQERVWLKFLHRLETTATPANAAVKVSGLICFHGICASPSHGSRDPPMPPSSSPSSPLLPSLLSLSPPGGRGGGADGGGARYEAGRNEEGPPQLSSSSLRLSPSSSSSSCEGEGSEEKEEEGGILCISGLHRGLW